MKHSEKQLYHQVHPLKLLTDVGTSFASTSLFWHARWLEAFVVAFAPSIIVTMVLLNYANLEHWRWTRLGVYVSNHMSARMVAVRIVGQLVVWLAAWGHVLWLIPFGYFVVVLAWCNGMWDVVLAKAQTGGIE